MIRIPIIVKIDWYSSYQWSIWLTPAFCETKSSSWFKIQFILSFIEKEKNIKSTKIEKKTKSNGRTSEKATVTKFNFRGITTNTRRIYALDGFCLICETKPNEQIKTFDWNVKNSFQIKTYQTESDRIFFFFLTQQCQTFLWERICCTSKKKLHVGVFETILEIATTSATFWMFFFSVSTRSPVSVSVSVLCSHWFCSVRIRF